MVKKILKRYFIDAMGAMAQGLFATLLISTILSTIAKYTGLGFLNDIAYYAKAATGMAIGVAIAHKLGAHPLVMYSCAVVGAMGNAMGAHIVNGEIVNRVLDKLPEGSSGVFYAAGPAGAFFTVILACEIAMRFSRKTKVDILLTPVITLLSGFFACFLFCPVISIIMYNLGVFISKTMTLHPILMGAAVSAVMGIILTLPISSAAICSMIFSASALEVAAANGNEEGFLLAGGACVAGCCAQMVGFAVISFRENRWGGIISQGLGTSMLQMSNIVKKPLIWVAPTVASMITGPLSATVFKLKCQGVAAGMGTCGLVGPLGVIDSTESSVLMWVGLVLICLVLPAILSLAVNELFRKLGWIKTGDMQLEA